jgi:LAO/AO transport system kinase
VSDTGELLARALAGERRALGRLLTVAERDQDAADELATALLTVDAPPAHVVGLTGAPGAGKSTLTARLIDLAVDDGRRVAVLAVDPSSPVSGGAILGDRIRMERPADAHPERVFIRSLASRGQLGGVSIAVPAMLRVLQAVGYDFVIVETVGVGQIEVDIAALADTTVVVVTPGWGDAIQANKAGLLEVADVFAVNKADRPGATDAVRDLEHMLDLAPPGAWRAPICPTVALDGTGVAELLTTIDDHRAHLERTESLDARRLARDRAELRARIERDVMRAVDRLVGESPQVIADFEARRVTANAAARQLAMTLLEIR